MRQVCLFFPDVESISSFLLNCKISNVETNSLEQSVKGTMTDAEIALACNQYNAMEFDPLVLKPVNKIIPPIYKPY
jgi:hypothetical protein